MRTRTGALGRENGVTVLQTLIQDRYRAVHGAIPAGDYPNYCSVGPSNAPFAALGYRMAGAQPLFLECYLDRPVEQVVSERLGRQVDRQRIVEIGDHASRRPAATLILWHDAARSLAGQAEIAVAVLTRSVRDMLERLGVPLIELAPARIEAVGTAAAQWGRYYDAMPIVCAGDIGTGLAALSGKPAR